MPPTLTSMSPELADQLDDFRASITSAAQKVIFEDFPRKILDLQAKIDSTNDPSSVFHSSHATAFTDATVHPEPDTKGSAPENKKRKRSEADSTPITDGGPVTNTVYARLPSQMVANKNLVNAHEDVKKECEDLAQLCDKVKLWINLTMPKIEDGDNFGVQIQEEVLTELHRSQESAFNLRDAGRQHHLSRAKICSKIMKYPHLEDYQIALREHDEKQLYLARQHIFDLRNIYAVLADLLHKNIAKIRAPKGNNGIAMY